METPNTKPTLEDWRSEITPSTDTLKVKDGDIVVATFIDEGTKKTHPDYGTSVCFSMQVISQNDKPVENPTEPKSFYVKSNNFDLLGQIKELGTLTGTKVRISRIGSTKSNTRYKIVKA